MRPAARITIRDVAEAAGVSVTTVSHAINGKGKVDPATRLRVHEAADRLGYRASRTARALRSGRTATIAVMMPAFESESIASEMLSLDYYVQLAGAAASTAFSRHHILLLTPPIDSLAELRSLGVDGGIVCDPATNDPGISMFDALGLPVVSVERDLGRPTYLWFVRSDNEANMWFLLDHMADAGAERIALLAPMVDWAWARECEAAYVTWCAGRGQQAIMTPAGLYALESSAHEASRNLFELPEPPDAVVALAERHASGVVRAAREHGLEIPRDLLVAAGIDSRQARDDVPSITALDLQPTLQGAAAAELLIARIEGQPTTAPRITPAMLRIRDSTSTRPGVREALVTTARPEPRRTTAP